MFFVRNELRTRRRFRFCTPCGYYCFNFHFFSFFSWKTGLDRSPSSITISTFSPRKGERPWARYRQIDAGWHIELDKLVSSSVAQKTKLIRYINWRWWPYGTWETVLDMSILSSNPQGQWIKGSHFSRAKSRMLSSSISVTTTRFHNPIRISLVFWATELDSSLSSSICQPSSICRYRAQGHSLFRGDKVKLVIELDKSSSSMTYRTRWPIELGDLPSSVFQVKKKREKMEIKAVITTWSTKSKTPSRSQFVTDKKHCVAGRLMMF